MLGLAIYVTLRILNVFYKKCLLTVQVNKYLAIHIHIYFIEQKITTNILQVLSEEMIAELIPVIGPRAIFLSYWRRTFKKNPLRPTNNDDVPKPKKIVS